VGPLVVVILYGLWAQSADLVRRLDTPDAEATFLNDVAVSPSGSLLPRLGAPGPLPGDLGADAVSVLRKGAESGAAVQARHFAVRLIKDVWPSPTS
jgi:hypothetical protein